MKALIFNSGKGSRLGSLTENCHKAALTLANGETILERQLRLLSECGITDFIITTGYMHEQLVSLCKNPEFSRLNITFVHNPHYAETNYIYSMFLAAPYFDDDMLILHGDLVFNRSLVQKIMNSSGSLALYNETLPLPEKDFKCSLVDGRLDKVSVSMRGACYAFQPFYKLQHDTARAWLAKVTEFVNAGNANVYAENALNEITKALAIQGFSYADDFIEEIDTAEDYERVSRAIRLFDFREQRTISGALQDALGKIILERNPSKVFLVASNSGRPKATEVLKANDLDYFCFSDFSPNPKLSDIAAGVHLFRQENCALIVSIGGGSAMDVAKCIKLFAGSPDYTDGVYQYSAVPHIAIPTTAGSGSEATIHAVYYDHGEKQSLSHDSMLPDFVILDPALTLTMPEYVRKCSYLDALCQAIESFWAKGATPESKNYARRAIEVLTTPDITPEQAQYGANLSGKAINISATTAPHAMSYKLSSLCKIAHGHAVALCLPPVFALMQSTDGTGSTTGLSEISGAVQFLETKFASFDLPKIHLTEDDIAVLTRSVNPLRLANNPVYLGPEEIRGIYRSLAQ